MELELRTLRTKFAHFTQPARQPYNDTFDLVNNMFTCNFYLYLLFQITIGNCPKNFIRTEYCVNLVLPKTSSGSLKDGTYLISFLLLKANGCFWKPSEFFSRIKKSIVK